MKIKGKSIKELYKAEKRLRSGDKYQKIKAGYIKSRIKKLVEKV